MAKKRTPKTFEDLTKEATLASLLRGESLRGKVLIGAAHIDNLLTVLLRTWLFHTPESKGAEDSLFDGANPPLGSWANKTSLAYRLGLIDLELKNIIDALRQIRNSFAHQIENANWDDPDVVKYLAKLSEVAELVKVSTGADSNKEELYHNAALLCIFHIKHTIGFCRELIERDKRPQVSAMVYMSISDQQWNFREKDNIAKLLKNHQTIESDEELLKWFKLNKGNIERVYVAKMKKKEAFGVSDISLMELDVPLSQSEESARQKVLDFMETIQDKPQGT